jgi:hypothetical protein
LILLEIALGDGAVGGEQEAGESGLVDPVEAGVGLGDAGDDLGARVLKGLRRPTEMTASCGAAAAKKAAVVEVRLPWWPTLSKVTRVMAPAANMARSLGASVSPSSRTEAWPYRRWRTRGSLLTGAPWLAGLGAGARGWIWTVAG